MKPKILSFVLVAFVALVSLSCSKSSSTTYSVSLTEDLYYYDMKMMVFECNDMSEKIHSNTIEDVVVGERYTFTASSDAVSKVKIYYKAEGLWGSSNRWVQQVFMLKKGGHTSIELNGETIVGSQEP